MTRLFSPSFLILLYTILARFSTVDAGFIKPIPKPERLPDPPELPNEILPDSIVNPNGAIIGESDAPFSGSESEEVEYLDLAEMIVDLFSSIIDFAAAETTSNSLGTSATKTSYISVSQSSTAAPTAFPSNKVNATLGCEIYQSYTSMCPSRKSLPYLIISTDIASSTEGLDSASSTRAACLCYSSVYWVPAVYDEAAWACAGYTASDSSPAQSITAAAASSALEVDGFCSRIGNVKVGATPATFGQFKPTSSPSSATFAVTTRPPSTGEGKRLYMAENRVVVHVVVIAIVAVLV